MRYIETQLKEQPLETPEILCYCPTLRCKDAIVNLWRKKNGEKTYSKPFMGATTLTKLSEKLWLIGPGIGSSAACLFTEPFLICGCKNILFFGVCASLDHNALQIGDICSPNQFIGSESIASYYQEISSPPLTASTSPLLKLAQVKQVATWSTDIPNFESPAKSRMMKEKGAIAVEMETAALFAMTRNYSCNFQAYLVATDVLEETWLRGFSSKAVEVSISAVAESIVSRFLV